MNRIMVATDFSERSDRALRRAILLARESGAELALVNAVDGDRPQPIVSAEKLAAEALLNELTTRIRAIDGLICEARVILAEPSEGIVQATHDIAPDLLVIGQHRRHFFKDVFVGTTAERTIRAAKYPVLMVNAAPAGSYRQVLITTDLSEASAAAMIAYSRLNLAGEALQSIVHVFDVPLLQLAVSRLMTKKERLACIEDERVKASHALARVLASTELGDVAPLVRHDETTAKNEILIAATEIGADLIVVATHSRRGLERAMLGSVTEAVLRHTSVDVLALPAVAT